MNINLIILALVFIGLVILIFYKRINYSLKLKKEIDKLKNEIRNLQKSPVKASKNTGALKIKPTNKVQTA